MHCSIAVKSLVVATVALLGCGTHAATTRPTCGAGWSSLTAERAPEATTGVAIKDSTTTIERVEVTGIDARFAATLRRELVTKPGTPLIEAPLGDDLRRLWRLGVISDASVELDGGVVRFVVAPRPAIRDVESKGGDALAQARFRQLEDTSFEPARVRRMAEALRESYVREGRLDAHVEARQRTFADGVDVCVAIDPGPRITIAKLEFPGAKAMPKAKLVAAMQSKERNKPGGLLDEDALATDELYLAALYWDHGYANVKVRERKIERRGNRINLAIPIDEGDVFRLGTITVTAPVQFRMPLKTGELFSRTRIADAREALASSDPAIDVVLPFTKVDLEKRTIDVTFEIQWRFPWDALRSWLSQSQ